MVNVGLVTGTVTPRARAAPRTNVVLPGAQLALDKHDVARGQLGREPASERFGLGRVM